MLAGLLAATDNQPLLKWPLLLLVLLALVYWGPALLTEAGIIHRLNTPRQFLGTLVMFTLLPCYLFGMMIWQRRRIQSALQVMSEIVPQHHHQAVQTSLHRVAPWGWLLVALGLCFGAYQNERLMQQMLTERLHLVDAVFVLGNCLVWGSVALLIAWRVPTSLALGRLGAAAKIDLYQAHRLQPLARIATTDVLVVAGALALTPLQALDAEFRLENYRAGFIVGITAAAALFVLTLWGAHRRLLDLREQRQQELQRSLDQLPRTEIGRLEALTAHLERVRTTPTWPIDLKLLTRVFVYFVIPPLAWVAAALVENMVDRF